MSSWIGHGIAAVTVCIADKNVKPGRADLMWALWLTVVAIAPDIDYPVPWLRMGPEYARVTHSILLALVLPGMTIFVGAMAGWRGQTLQTRGVQVVLAGLSHLLLDLLVGVHGMPLFFPATLTTFTLPFGILPSAPLLRLTNPLLYRNLFIEIGALAPLAGIAYLAGIDVQQKRVWMGALALCSILFMGWAFTLAR